MKFKDYLTPTEMVRCLCNCKIVYILFIAMALIVTIYEIPTMNTSSVVLDTHQFAPHTLVDDNNNNNNNNNLETMIRNDLQINSNRNDDNLSHKTVFITGIAGFIGMSLAKQLANKTQFPYTNVIGIDSFNTYYIPKLKRERAQTLIRLGVNVIFGDLCNEILIADIFSTYNISIIVHLAAQAGVRYSIQYPHSYVRNNIDCSVYLFEIIKNKNIFTGPIVYASSSSIYGDNDFKNEPLKDTMNINNYKPKSVYAASKVATENLASVYSKMYNLTMVGLRFFTVYGSFGRPDMALWTFTDRLLKNEKIKLYNNGDMMRDFTHWSDIVDGVELAMEYALKTNIRNTVGSNDIFNLGKGNVRSLHEFMEILLGNLQMSTDITSNPLIELADTPGGEVLFTSADLNKSKQVLGYLPQTELEIGIPEFINWYKKDWIIKEKIQKQYLLISTFYIAMTDPRKRQNNINYSFDFEFAKNYINKWYISVKKVMNIKNLALSQLDVVIIHDGLEHDIFEYFADIVFVNMAQFPNPLLGHAMRRSPNDIRYFHFADYLKSSGEDEYEIVIITDLHDVMFGMDPFKYLIEKRINTMDLYVGCEVIPQQSLWSFFPQKGEKNKNIVSGTWYKWVRDRLNACFKKEIVNKCLEWINSKDGLPTNPGIIAAKKEIMVKYLDKMQYQLTKTNQFNTTSEHNCNYAAVLVSIVELCYEDKECNVINDEMFHSPYRQYKKPNLKSEVDSNKWVIYHK